VFVLNAATEDESICDWW